MAGGFQFIHIDSYGREGSVQTKTTKKGNQTITKKVRQKSAKEIFDEQMRIDGSCPHVENPKPPKIVYGVNPLSLVPEIEKWAENTKDSQGRKLRKDANCVVVGVASLPREMSGNFDQFTKDTVSLLKQKYGDRLKSVVAHDDEAHPHLHFTVVPKIGEKFDDIHQGFKASRTAKAQGKNKGEQNKAYVEAMRDFQDEFSKKVALKNGLTRMGPARRRLTRAEWQAEKKQAMALAEALEEAKKVKTDIKKYQGKGFEAGYKKGLEKANKLSSKVSGFLKLTLKRWHKPTKEVEAEKRELEKKIIEEQESAKKLLLTLKMKVDEDVKQKIRMISELREEVEKFNRQAINDQKSYKELSEYTDRIYDELLKYKKKFDPPTSPPKNN